MVYITCTCKPKILENLNFANGPRAKKILPTDLNEFSPGRVKTKLISIAKVNIQ